MIFRHFMFNLFLLLCSFPSFCLKFCILFYILNLSLFRLYIFNQIFPSFFLLILCFNLFRTFVLRQIPPFFYFLFLQSYELELLFSILLFFFYIFSFILDFGFLTSFLSNSFQSTSSLSAFFLALDFSFFFFSQLQFSFWTIFGAFIFLNLTLIFSYSF